MFIIKVIACNGVELDCIILRGISNVLASFSLSDLKLNKFGNSSFSQQCAYSFEAIVWGRHFSTQQCPHCTRKDHEEMVFWGWCGRTWQNPDLKPIEHLWDELERCPRSRPYRPKHQCPKLIKAFEAQWGENPYNQHLMKSLFPRREWRLHSIKLSPTV